MITIRLALATAPRGVRCAVGEGKLVPERWSPELPASPTVRALRPTNATGLRRRRACLALDELVLARDTETNLTGVLDLERTGCRSHLVLGCKLTVFVRSAYARTLLRAEDFGGCTRAAGLSPRLRHSTRDAETAPALSGGTKGGPCTGASCVFRIAESLRAPGRGSPKAS